MVQQGAIPRQSSMMSQSCTFVNAWLYLLTTILAYSLQKLLIWNQLQQELSIIKRNNQYLLMNEEVQKIIRASFCPKEKWVKDELAINCFKCDKKFHSLYRRKHHCRYCGQVFCATCSDFSLPSKALGQGEKSIRMCQACIQKCWKYIAKHDDSYIEHRKSGDHDTVKELPSNIEQIQLESRSSNYSQEDKLKEIQAIIEEYSGNQMNGIKKLEQEIHIRFAALVQVILKQSQIPLKYLPQLREMAIEIVNRVPPNFVVTGKMNVCQNVRIKGFYGQEFSLALQPIMLIKKAFTSKRIKDQYANMTCILVYGNIESQDLVGGDREASFENMMNNRLKEMNKIISYCQRVKVNLIFLEGAIQKQFEDLLIGSSITVIPKVKVEYLSRLKSSLRIQKIVEGIGKVYAYPQKEITGDIKKITSVSYTSAKQGNALKKFFKIHTAKDQLGITLVMQHSSAKMLQSLKKQFRFMLQILTHLKLKVHKVRMDQGLLQSMNQQMRKSCYLHNSQMFFSFYAQFHYDILSYIKEKYVSYKQITYVESDFANYPQVDKGSLKDYNSSKTHTFKNKWTNFTQICNSIQDEHKIFYSQQDTPLGSFILKKLTALDKKCSVCCRPNYLHKQVYYSTDQYVKIWAESMIVDNLQSNCYSSFTSQNTENEQKEEMEMIFTYLQKHITKEKLKCFIQCYDCQEPLSSHQNVYKPDLQFSFLSFLQHMFKGSTETTIRENNKRVPPKSKNAPCHHLRKVRVFNLGQKSIKFFVGKYSVNRQSILTITGRDQFLKSKENKAALQVCTMQASRIQRIMDFLFDQIKAIAQHSKNTKFESIVKNPRTSFIDARQKARNSMVGTNDLRLSQAQCIDMIIPQLIDQVMKVKDIARILLSFKRVNKYLQGIKMSFLFMILLRRCYVIISEVKKAVRRRQLDKKYQVKDFQNDLMEDIDINQYADSASSVDTQSQYNSSDISKSDLYSNIQNVDTATADTLQYNWLKPITTNEPVISRHDRKTQSNILIKKNSKISQEDVYKVFKTISSAIKIEDNYTEFVPSYPNRPQTLIAAALNCKIHKECLQQTQSFKNELIIKANCYLDNDYPLLDNEEYKKLHSLIQTQERMFDIASKIKRDQSVSLQIILIEPNEFEMLRRKNNISLELFISSIGGADNWMATGGKSGSSFMRSYNDLLVIKKIPKSEFMTFKKSLSQYFTHLHSGSILTPIYGAFIINRNLSSDYYIAMQNLFFGMKQWYLYDFKGSVTRRFSKPPIIPLDINYLIDRQSEPIFCKDNVLQYLQPTLKYLSANRIIDYSLILVVEIQNSDDYYLDGNRFQIGIVDYMREFGTGQRIQNIIKGPQATVVEPRLYYQRMLRNLKKYFTQIPL